MKKKQSLNENKSCERPLVLDCKYQSFLRICLKKKKIPMKFISLYKTFTAPEGIDCSSAIIGKLQNILRPLPHSLF